MQKGCCDVFGFTDNNSNSWLITSLIKSVPVVINTVLDEDEKQIFNLIFYENLTQSKCASVLGKSRNTINYKYHKAIEKLTTHLQVIECVLKKIKED